jgi:radical SAM superfamily enzyme YgiQ (UPF0313 family)
MKNINSKLLNDSKSKFPSLYHNITIYYDVNNKLQLRQINNLVALTDTSLDHLRKIMGTHKIVNVTPNDIQKLLGGTIEHTELVEKVTTFIFISSYGLIDDAEWTSYQPSEGISLLSEWLAKNEPSAAPLFIDPNLVSKDDLIPTIQKHVAVSQNVVFGFSIIPANIQNDIQLILKIKQAVPDSTIVVGGIGSDALKLLPTNDGKVGLQNALPIDLILVDDGLVDLSNTSRKLSGITDEFRSSGPDFSEISESRLIANELFIPYKFPDIIHKIPYDSANNLKRDTVAQILVDNRCAQNCFFCSSPKQQRFQNVEAALDHIEEKSRNAEVIAFNDNDLSHDIGQTIELCYGMASRNIFQPKYGKFGARQFSPELIDALKLANFKRIAIGVESFDQNVRTSLGKKDFTDENITAILNYLLQKNIQPEINLIIASPADNYDSLKTTVTQALKWAQKGCLLFTTIGLSAVANSPAVMRLMQQKDFVNSSKIEFKEIFQEGMKSLLLLPKYWRASEEMISLRDDLINARTSLLFELHEHFDTKMPVPVRNYVIVTLVASLLGMDGFKSKNDINQKIYEYAEKNYLIPYVNI